jgi:hypothetical protein
MNWESIRNLVSTHSKAKIWTRRHFESRRCDDLFSWIEFWIKSQHQKHYFRWSTYKIYYIWCSIWRVFDATRTIFLCVFFHSSTWVCVSFWIEVINISCFRCLDSCIWICINQSSISDISRWESARTFDLSICQFYSESACKLIILVWDSRFCIDISRFDIIYIICFDSDHVSNHREFLQESVAIEQNLYDRWEIHEYRR